MQHSSARFTTLSFAFAAGLLSVTSLFACSAPPDPEGESSASAISVGPPGGGFGGSSGGKVGPPTYGPPVEAPAYFGAGFAPIPDGGTWPPAVQLSWYEQGNPLNPQSVVFRQKYDAYGNVLGAPAAIATLQSLPAGPAGYVDHTADLDRETCYQISEQANGCYLTPGGYSCVGSPWSCVYTKPAKKVDASRVQVRLKVSSVATAEGVGDHVSVALNPNNKTWIDTTHVDFGAGSNVTFDLKTDGVGDQSDITYLSIQTPDSNSLCINEVELLVDNTRTFFKSYGADGQACQWVWESTNVAAGGTEMPILGSELRTNAAWLSFAPPDLSPNPIYGVVPFAGFRAPELIATLDSIWGDVLKNPASGYGPGAGLRDGTTTTTSPIDKTHLHVQQHIVADDAGFWGKFNADPSYDLVIHEDATCAPKNYCVKVENLQGNTDYRGWLDFVPKLGLLLHVGLDSIGNGRLESAVSAMAADTLNDPPNGFSYCFPMPPPAVHGVPFTPNQGFGQGSLTVCP